MSFGADIPRDTSRAPVRLQTPIVPTSYKISRTIGYRRLAGCNDRRPRNNVNTCTLSALIGATKGFKLRKTGTAYGGVYVTASGGGNAHTCTILPPQISLVVAGTRCESECERVASTGGSVPSTLPLLSPLASRQDRVVYAYANFVVDHKSLLYDAKVIPR